MTLRSADFESAASASSTIPALYYKYIFLNYLCLGYPTTDSPEKQRHSSAGTFIRNLFSIA